jgi:hypothetical protein
MTVVLLRLFLRGGVLRTKPINQSRRTEVMERLSERDCQTYAQAQEEWGRSPEKIEERQKALRAFRRLVSRYKRLQKTPTGAIIVAIAARYKIYNLPAAARRIKYKAT